MKVAILYRVCPSCANTALTENVVQLEQFGIPCLRCRRCSRRVYSDQAQILVRYSGRTLNLYSSYEEVCARLLKETNVE